MTKSENVTERKYIYENIKRIQTQIKMNFVKMKMLYFLAIKQ